MKLDFKTLFKFGLLAFIVYICISYWNDISVTIIGATMPIIIGFVIAYLVNIIMTFYECRYFPASNNKLVIKTRMPVCMTAAFLTVVAVIALVAALIVPQLISCIQILIGKLPAATDDLVARLSKIDFIPPDVIESLKDIDWEKITGIFAGGATSITSTLLSWLLRSITAVFSVLVTVFLSIIFSIYILLNKKKLKHQFGRALKHYLKPEWYNRTAYALDVFNNCFRRYIIGQSTEAVILGVLCTVGMYILNMPYATMIGALITFTALIPVAGAFIGAGIGAFMILTEDPLKALIFIIFIVILQQLEGNLIYPKVVGSSLGLPAMWVLAAVTVGGGLFGITGMLVFVPLTAAIWKMVKDDINKGPRGGTEIAAEE